MQYRMDRLCLDFAPPVLRELTKTYLKGCSVREHLAMLNIQEVDEKDKDCIKEMKKSCHLEDLDFTKLLILINTFQSSENGACIKKLRKIRNVAIHERSAKQFQDAEEILLSLAKFVDSQRKLKILYDETKTKIEGLKRTEVKLIQQQNKLRDRLRQGNKYVTDFFQPVIITGNISGCKNEERIREQLEIESASTSSKMVMDFDCSSSLCRKIENNNSIFTIRTAENVYSDKHFGDLLSKNPVWIYCNGYDKSSKQEEKEQLKIREWRLKRQKGISKAINEIKNRYAGSIKVIILVFEECAQNNPLFKVTRDLIENDYPDKCDVVIISDEEGFIQEIKKLTSDYLYEDQCEDLFVTGMGWDLVSDELKTSFKVNSDIDCILPCRGGNTVVMTRKERGVYTDLEIVSGEECMHQLEEMDKNMRTLKMEETKETFYRGKGISWWNFYFNGQVGRRSVFDDYCRIVRNRVEKGKNVERFVINHNPGAGGTTLGMHILWQFSQFSEAGGAANAYRCCKLIKITPGTKDQVVNLCMFKEKENQKPVILLIDDEHEDALNDFYDELYDEARKHSNVKILCCVVIVKRVPTDMSVKPPERLLSPHLKSDEKVWFDNKYKELEEEYNTVYVNSLISFNFLKNSYNPQAIQTTADRLIKDVKKEEKDILKCLSVIGTFERKRHAVPFRVFDCLMTGSLKNKTWNTCLSEAMNLLVTETQDDDAIGITVISQPLAKAILENFRRVEGINLEYVVRDLLDLLERNQANGTFFAQKLKRIIESLFKRDNERTGSAAAAKKDVFSALIHKLDEQRINETPESAHRRVLNELERCFELTEDPMVGQQIARFYNHIHKFSEAEKTIKKAIDMKPTSSCLLDTYGHIFKTKMSYLIKQGTDKEKTIPDINVSEIIDMAFEATAKFHEGQTLAYKEHLKSTKRNISPFYNELRTVIMLLEKFKTFESYTNHKDLLSYLNEPGLDVGESSYKGLVELSPKMLDLRQGTNYQVHLMEILQYTRDRTNQIKFYKVDSEEGDLILNFSERLARFYGDNKSTGHCYFTCPIDLKAMMDGMSSKKRRQSVIDRFETSKKNLESEVADIDDRDLLVYLGYKIIELSGRLPNTELCSEDEYKKFLRYSNCLVESQLQIPGRILLEVFLYHAMLHWPSDIRLSSDYDNFCPPRQYKAYLKQWEKNFYSNHFLQTTEQKEKNRPKTFFAFGKGSPGNDIINLKVIQQRIWQMEKDDERHLSGQASDEPWDEDIVKEQLKSFRGIVNGEGTALSHTVYIFTEFVTQLAI